MEESRDLLLRYSRGENSGVPGPLQLRLLVGGPDEFGLHITLFITFLGGSCAPPWPPPARRQRPGQPRSPGLRSTRNGKSRPAP